MIIQHIQTELHKMRNKLSAIFSRSFQPEPESQTLLDKHIGVLRLRILIPGQTLSDDEILRIYFHIIKSNIIPQKVKVEVEQADIPNDKCCYLTEIYEGKLEWQGYLSRWPEKYCIGSAQQAVSFPRALQDDWLDFCNALQRDIVVIPFYRPLFP